MAAARTGTKVAEPPRASSSPRSLRAAPVARAPAPRSELFAAVHGRASGDRFEHEAERVARQALRAPRRCACGGATGPDGECAACRARRLARMQPHGAPRSVHAALAGPGRALDASARAFFEPRLGADLGGVRVHEDGASTADVSARAYTVGSDIVFAPGRYGRELLAHELAHVLQQQPRVQRQDAPVEANVRVTPVADGVNVEVTPARTLSGRELYILVVMYARRISWERAVRLVNAGEDVGCAAPQCETGVQAGETVELFFGADRRQREQQVQGPPRKLAPDVEDALKNGWVWLFLNDRDTRKRIKVSSQPEPGEDRAVVGVRNSLLLLTEADKACFWRWVPKGPITGWWELHYRLQQFLEVRADVCAPVDASIFGTLGGSEDAYLKLKEAEKQRMLVAVGVAPREQLEAAEAARDQALQAAGFESVGAFDEAARTFRAQFRPVAVDLLQQLLAQSDAIFADAGNRYMKWDGTVTPLGHQLYDQLYREYRGPPLERLKDEHPVLRGAKIWDTLSRAGGETEFFSRLGRFALERRQDVHMVRNALKRDADVVFEFAPVVDAALQRLGAADTVYASIVRDPRYKPSKPLWRKIVDIGLLLLSFVPGPIGILARTASGLIDFAESVKDYEEQLAASGLGLQERPTGVGVVVSVAAPLGTDVAISGITKAAGGVKRIFSGSGKALEEVAETEVKAVARTEAHAAESAAPTPMIEHGRPVPVTEPSPPIPVVEPVRPVPVTEPARPVPVTEPGRPVPATAGDQPRPVPETAGDLPRQAPTTATQSTEPARMAVGEPVPARTVEPARPRTTEPARPAAEAPAPATTTDPARPGTPEPVRPAAAEPPRPAPGPEPTPPAGAAGPVLSEAEQRIAEQEAVVARRQAALTAAQNDVSAAHARASAAARDVTVAETEVAALRSRAEEARRLAKEAEARLPAGAKSRARSPAVGPRKAAEETEAELRRSERALRRARESFDEAQAALKRPTKRLKNAQDTLRTSEDHLERVRNASSGEAPRLPGTATTLDPKMRRPNFGEIDHLPYHPPDFHTGMRTDPNARVGVFHQEVPSALRAEHDALMQRMAAPGANRQALGHEYEALMQRDAVEGITRDEAKALRRQSDVADKLRKSDIGTYEITIEKRIHDEKFDQLWRDLQAIDAGASEAANRIILVVPKLDPEDAIKLAKIAAFYERITGRRPTITVRETMR